MPGLGHVEARILSNAAHAKPGTPAFPRGSGDVVVSGNRDCSAAVPDRPAGPLGGQRAGRVDGDGLLPTLSSVAQRAERFGLFGGNRVSVEDCRNLPE